jgi:hypothetical protein
MARRTRLRWQLVVNSYPCPACGAGPGHGCRTPDRPKPEPHAERARLAHYRGWASSDEPARCFRCNRPLPGEDPAPGRCARCIREDGPRLHATADDPGPDGSYDVPLFGEDT